MKKFYPDPGWWRMQFYVASEQNPNYYKSIGSSVIHPGDLDEPTLKRFVSRLRIDHEIDASREIIYIREYLKSFVIHTLEEPGLVTKPESDMVNDAQ